MENLVLSFGNLAIANSPLLVVTPPPLQSLRPSCMGFFPCIYLPVLLPIKLTTLPLDPRAIPDGDGFTTYVDACEMVPDFVEEAMAQRAQARLLRGYALADVLLNTIVQAGFRTFKAVNGGEILARKLRIRLRGIDAPELDMPYGTESRDGLVSLIGGRRVVLHIYNVDRYGRFVADVYRDEVLVQQELLTMGLAWHYHAHDSRPGFRLREKDARASRRGLWAADKPHKPWKRRSAMQNAASIVSC